MYSNVEDRLSRFSLPSSNTIVERGAAYNRALVVRAQALFTNLLNLLPSNYISTVQGPNYTEELKAVAVELARLELALEAVSYDSDFRYTRTEFLYQTVGYLVYLNGKLPKVSFDDVEFRAFLLKVIEIYFKGSVPSSLRDAIGLFFTENVTVHENFILVRQGASGLDISDQFGFQIDLDASGGSFPPDFFDHQENVRHLLDIIRPAHTLFRIRVVFTDKYAPNGDEVGRILDDMKWDLSAYWYDDLRKNFRGLSGVDRLGVKGNVLVLGEDHSSDF